MKYNPDIHHRRSIRLKEYDYSGNGAYFVTICTQNRDCLFGEISGEDMEMNAAGRLVAEWWAKLPDKFNGVSLDEFRIMPNHFHGIVVLVGAPPCGCPDDVDLVGADPCVCPPLTAGEGESMEGAHIEGAHIEGAHIEGAHIKGAHMGAPLHRMVQWFKTMTTNAYIRGVKDHNWPPFPGRLWQRNYYERIIRDEDELTAIREYIINNPARWAEDKENPDS